MKNNSSTLSTVSNASQQPSQDNEDSWKLTPGALAGEYVLQAVAGVGGHSTVYQAEHRILGRRVALKVLHSHLSDMAEMLQRFVREAQIINRIRHPNIVDIYDFGVLPDGSPYYVMELLPSRTLSHVLLERGRLSPERTLEFLGPICDAMEAAHQGGVVHRDLKPSNVAIVSDGSPPQIKLLDFGIAKILHPDPDEPGLTADGERLGTPHAMAPEQIRGGVIGPTTDIYAMGVLLYRMLTGDYPFQSTDQVDVERMHLEAPPPRPSARAPVPIAVDAVVLRCMEKEADRRYPNVAALYSAFREAVAPPASARSAANRQIARAFVVHAEAVLEPEDEDDATYSAASQALDSMEQELRDAGFILTEQMGMALVGMNLLDKPSSLAPRQLLAIARAIHRHTQTQVAGSRVRVHLCAHVGHVETRQGPDGIELIGGPLADTAGWIIRDASGFATTLDARRACHL